MDNLLRNDFISKTSEEPITPFALTEIFTLPSLALTLIGNSTYEVPDLISTKRGISTKFEFWVSIFTLTSEDAFNGLPLTSIN